MPASIELRDIHKEYGGRQIIKGVSLTVAPSEFLVLVGPSGPWQVNLAAHDRRP